MIWRQRQHLGQGRFGRCDTCRPVVGQKNADRNKVNKCGADQRLDIAGIERERLFIKAARLRQIFGSQSLIRASHALKIEVHRVGKRCPLRAPRFGLDQLCAQLTGKPRDNLVLHVEEIGHRLVEALGP